ncbi:MAG: hypothetical protein LBP19_06470 [Treponema sp.]|jgi:hypothetical protein|nr:hypothetical protein [Treponema sp.]
MDIAETYDDEKRECYLCGNEDDFDDPPYGWIRDVHPLCKYCADKVLKDTGNKFHASLSYHYKVGVIS